MARYILLSSASGYIMGDSADFAAGRQSDLTPLEAARRLDREIGSPAADYVEIRHIKQVPDGADGYHVYRADIDGSEAVTVVTDGTDPETIEAVMRNCDYEGFVQRIE